MHPSKMTTFPISSRELDSRYHGGIHVRLLWCEHGNQVFVAVHDPRTGETFCIDVRDGDRPLEVFRHPYAYVARRSPAGTAPVASAPPPTPSAS
jgi:hypothetical protein